MPEDKIDSLLRELEAQESFEQEHPDAVRGREKMLAITREIGLFYNILLRHSGSRSILEVGTSTGYSTIWFAEAIRGLSGSKVITIERDDFKIARAKANFRRAGLDHMIEVRQGSAAEILREISYEKNQEFDFIFIDADKERCIEYFDASLQLIRVGGMIGVDNMIKPKKFAPYMAPLLEHARRTRATRSVVVPVDNGELLCVKLDDRS